MRVFVGIRLRLVLWSLTVTILAATPSVSFGQEGPKLESVKPTVFFQRDGTTLYQVADATVNNPSDGPIEVTLETQMNGGGIRKASATVPQGASTIQLLLPDVDKPTQVTIRLEASGKQYDRLSTTWQPQRKWQVYFVPITHHDLGYTDTIENVLDDYGDYYDNILSFCRKTEDWPYESQYRYTSEGTWAIQHFLATRDTASREEFGKYVQRGRIEIGALLGNEISGLCSDEELVRLMYPSFRLARKYHGTIMTGSITDVPGLSWGLPTVLSGAGVKYFFAGLPTYFEWNGRTDIHDFWDESVVLRHGRPDAFRWKGPDGASVLVYYQGGYGFFDGSIGPNSYQSVKEKLPAKLEKLQKNGSPFSVVRYIHNGRDNYPPDMKISEIVRRWNDRWAYPKLCVATNTMFFQELEKQCSDVRTFAGELPHTDYVVGAASTAKETGINRLTHDALSHAERLATISSLATGAAYPAKSIEQAYRDMMLYDEHTWGKDYPMGRVQDWAWHEKSRYAYRAAALTQQVTDASVQHLVGEIERKEDGHYIVVLNPNSFPSTSVVRVPRFQGNETQIYDLSDPNGDAIECQIVDLSDPQSPVPYAAYRYALGQSEPVELRDLVFVAEDVPPLGYKVFKMAGKSAGHFVTSPRAATDDAIDTSKTTLENRFYRIQVDRETGGVRSIYDKELQRELVDTAGPHHVNQFVMRWVQSGKIEGPRDVTVVANENGPVYSSLVVKAQGPGCPQLTQEILLYHKIKRIDFANRVLKDSTPMQEIYFAFPFQMAEPEFCYEGSDSVIRPFQDQFPGSNTNYFAVQHWVDVSNRQYGITLSSAESHLFEFGGLWPNYCSHAHHGVDPPNYGAPFITPSETNRGHVYSFVMSSNFVTNFQPVQQSDTLFRYSLTSHQGDWRQGDCARFGRRSFQPFVVAEVLGKQEGRLAADSMSFCSVGPPNVLLTAFKQAEDGRGAILRLIETQGRATTASVFMPHIGIHAATTTDLVEEDQQPASFSRHRVQTDLKPFGIATIRIAPE